MNSIKFVYFDIGNVLLLFQGGLQKMADKHGKTYSDFEKVFRKYDDLVCRGGMSSQELWHKYEEEIGIHEDDFNFADYWIDCCIPIKEVFELVQHLHTHGLRVGLLSNLYTDIYSVILKKNLFPFTSWDAKVISSEIKMAKPDVEMYAMAEQRAGVAPQEILFIDDKQDFLNPAIQRGWKTFLFDPTNPKESVSNLEKVLSRYHVLT